MYALVGELRELCDRGPLLLQKRALQPHKLAASKCHADCMRLLHREVPKQQDRKQEQTLVGANKTQIITFILVCFCFILFCTLMCE